MARAQVNIQVGDRVKYKAAFLRSIGCLTGPLPFARGTVTDIIALSGDTRLAVMDWKNPDVPATVNVANLTHAAKVEAD